MNYIVRRTDFKTKQFTHFDIADTGCGCCSDSVIVTSIDQLDAFERELKEEYQTQLKLLEAARAHLCKDKNKE